MNGEDASQDMEENLNGQRANGYCENASLSNGQFSANFVEIGKENKVHDENTGTGNTKVDGLQDFVVAAEETQINEASQREGTGEARINDEGANQKGESNLECLQQPVIGVEGKDQCELTNEENIKAAKGTCLSTQSKPRKAVTNVLGKSGNASSQVQKLRSSQNLSISSKGVSKVATRISMDTLSKQKNGEDAQFEGSEVTSPPSNGSLRSSVNSGMLRSNHTIPQPFALATNKRASTGVQPAEGNVAGSAARRTSAGSDISSSAIKKPQLAEKSISTPAVTKFLHSQSLKLHNQNVKPLKQRELKQDDDDAHSVTFSTATTRGSKPRTSSAAPASGFSFRCNERAEKRKEFFSKLEEKIQAKEVEKSHLQAKSKECQEAEIKQLRKSLTFKATPMPSFYQEAAPPKIELKKIPTTRAKSPKLGRQYSSVGSESEGNPGRFCRPSRFSLDQSKINGGPQKNKDVENDKVFGKESVSAKKTMRRSLTKLPSQKSIMTKPNERPYSPKQQMPNKSETESSNGSTENDMVTTCRTVQDSSASASDEKRVNMHESEAAKDQNEAQWSNGKHGITEVNVESNTPRESVEYADNEVVALHDVSQALEGSKIKSNEMEVVSYATLPEQNSAEKTTENNGKGGLTTIPEQVKPVEPSFSSSKREIVGLASEMNMQDMASVVADVAVQF